MTITQYIKENYLELNERAWRDLSVLLFSQFLMQEDNEAYREIMDDIDFDDLHDSLTDNIDIERQCKFAQNQVIHAFKAKIRSQVETLQGDIDEAEEQRLEGISLDNQRLM